MIAPLLLSSLYSIEAVCSACTTLLASESDRLPYSRLQFGPRHHSTTVTPTATAAAMPSSSSNGRIFGPTRPERLTL